MNVLYILIAILIFGFLILIHEAGHYVAARLCHVKIFEFAIGMGPRLLWFRSKKTGIVYSLRMFPIGGFVSMQGELTEEGDTALDGGEEYYPGDENRGPLAAKPAWQRLIVHCAGAVMNLILGIVVIAVMTCVTPLNRLGSTVVAELEEPPAGAQYESSGQQGLQVGDKIIQVGNKKVYIADQVSYEVLHKGGSGEAMKVVVIRDGEQVELSIRFPVMQDPASGMIFGATDFKVYQESQKDFATVTKHIYHKFVYNATMVWDSLFDFIGGKYSMDAVSGPIGTAGVISDAAASGDANYLFSLVALITINLGIFNLLPIPALDGSHILYTLVEMITRRKPPARFIQIVDTIGLVVLLGFILVVTFNDCTKLFR